VATQFYDYVIVLWPSRQFIAVSYKSTGITATAKPLNGLVSERGTDIYEGRYRMTSFSDKNAKGNFRSAMIVNHPTAPWLTDEEAEFTKAAFHALKTDKRAAAAFDRDVQEGVSEADDSPEAAVRSAAAATVTAPDKDVPF